VVKEPMSKREQFAMAAMAVLLAHHGDCTVAIPLAQHVVQYVDTMIAELAKEK